MMRLRRVMLLGAIGLLVSVAEPAEVLTNEAIISMIKAGLGEDLIIMKIKSSPNNFDLSTSNLVNLKQQGVSERILKAMMETEGQTQGGKKEAATETYPVPRPPVRLLLLRDGKLIEMDYVAGSMQASIGNAFKRAFMFSMHDEAALIIQGESAKFRITEKVPVFRFSVNPEGRFLIVRFVKDIERHIRYVMLYRRPGSTDWVTKPGEEIAIEYTKEQDGYYIVRPKTDLQPGEYGIVPGYRTVYDFCID